MKKTIAAMLALAFCSALNGCAPATESDVPVRLKGKNQCPGVSPDVIDLAFSPSAIYVAFSLNDGALVYDECAPSKVASVDRNAGGIGLSIPLPLGSAVRSAYFPTEYDSQPLRNDVVITVTGRASCSDAPVTLVARRKMFLTWSSNIVQGDNCVSYGYEGFAQ